MNQAKHVVGCSHEFLYRYESSCFYFFSHSDMKCLTAFYNERSCLHGTYRRHCSNCDCSYPIPSLDSAPSNLTQLWQQKLTRRMPRQAACRLAWLSRNCGCQRHQLTKFHISALPQNDGIVCCSLCRYETNCIHLTTNH